MLYLRAASPSLTFPPVVSHDSAPRKFRSFLFFPSSRPRRRMPDSLMGVEGIQRAVNGCETSRVSCLLRRCKGELDGEGDPSLEDEILEFMEGSENPNSFPSKKQLLDAGRADLVDEILRQGGWLSWGWDLDCEDGSKYCPYDIDCGEQSGDGIDREVGSSNQRSGYFELETTDVVMASSLDSSHSGLSLESQAESNSGIEGILSRLEKERNIAFGVGLRDKGGNDLISMDDVQNIGYQGMPTDDNSAIVSEELRELSDAWEFQETEVMHAQDRLRSIRAKLAILDGKMALAIIDSQKIVEEKQKRVEGTRRALRLLRTASIVWPNSASEVLLSGSFDGWSTQRRMEKSSAGVFSLCLKLYPGRYEIKFIVDGIWRIDPLRPIISNNGMEDCFNHLDSITMGAIPRTASLPSAIAVERLARNNPKAMAETHGPGNIKLYYVIRVRDGASYTH